MLILTGPPGSGLRELILFCRRLGYATGGDLQETLPPRAEDRICQINQEIQGKIERAKESERRVSAFFGKLGPILPPAFRKPGSANDLKTVAKEYKQALHDVADAVIIDPRFMDCPELLAVWHNVHSGLRVLHTCCMPEQCGDLRDPGIQSPLPLETRVQEHFADSIEMLLQRDIDFRLLLYPSFLKQYDTVCAAFSDLGLVFDPAEGKRLWNDLTAPGEGASDPAIAKNETGR